MSSEGVRVAVVMGGLSAESDVSRKTGECVTQALARNYLVKPVALHDDGAWTVPAGFVGHGLHPDPTTWFQGEPQPLLPALTSLKSDNVDVVFNALHGPWGEDGTVQGLFRYAGLPFTGPDVVPAAVTMDKCFTKDVLRGAGIATPRWVILPDDGHLNWRGWVDEQSAKVPFPWVVKPRRLGSSVGVEFFSTPEKFLDWIEARSHRAVSRGRNDLSVPEYLVEEVARGRELSCGVLETDASCRALPPIEIRPRTSSFFDYHAKYTPGACEDICPAPLRPAETAAVQELSVAVHRLFGCAPLSRTDLFLTEDGTLTVLEINTLPGMTETSLIPLSAGKARISFEELLGSLLDHALRRARLPVFPQVLS